MYSVQPSSWRSLVLSTLLLGACARAPAKDDKPRRVPSASCDAGAARASDLNDSIDGVSYLAFDTTLSADEPHVLAVEDSDEIRVDGVLVRSSAEAAVRSGGLELSYLDDVGRDVELTLCIDSLGQGSGDVVRCRGERCESGTVRSLPLVRALDERTDAAAPRWQLVDEYAGSTWPEGPTIDLAVSDAVAILARGEDGLRILSTRDGDGVQIAELAHVAPARDDFYNDVKLYADRFALVASRLHGLVVVDLENPAAPKVVYDRLDVPQRTSGHNIFVRGERAYVARSDPGGHISVIDLASPTEPVVNAEITLSECVDIHDLHVAGDRAFVNCFDGRLLVVDASDETAWVVLSSIEQTRSHSSWLVETQGRSLLLYSGESFGAGVELAWLTAGGVLEPFAKVGTRAAASVHTLECDAARCFVTAYQQGFLELDVSASALPSVAHHEPTWLGPGRSFFEGATGIAMRADVLHVADTERGLLVYGRTAGE